MTPLSSPLHAGSTRGLVPAAISAHWEEQWVQLQSFVRPFYADRRSYSFVQPARAGGIGASSILRVARASTDGSNALGQIEVHEHLRVFLMHLGGVELFLCAFAVLGFAPEASSKTVTDGRLSFCGVQSAVTRLPAAALRLLEDDSDMLRSVVTCAGGFDTQIPANSSPVPSVTESAQAVPLPLIQPARARVLFEDEMSDAGAAVDRIRELEAKVRDLKRELRASQPPSSMRDFRHGNTSPRGDPCIIRVRPKSVLVQGGTPVRLTMNFLDPDASPFYARVGSAPLQRCAVIERRYLCFTAPSHEAGSAALTVLYTPPAPVYSTDDAEAGSRHLHKYCRSVWMDYRVSGATHDVAGPVWSGTVPLSHHAVAAFAGTEIPLPSLHSLRNLSEAQASGATDEGTETETLYSEPHGGAWSESSAGTVLAGGGGSRRGNHVALTREMLEMLQARPAQSSHSPSTRGTSVRSAPRACESDGEDSATASVNVSRTGAPTSRATDLVSVSAVSEVPSVTGDDMVEGVDSD
jgi:hypothetical protein